MILRIFQLEEWTLIIQKSTVIPPSPSVLFTMSWQLFIIIIMELSHLLHQCQHRSCRHQLHWLRSNLLGSQVSTRWASPHTGIYKKLRICLLSMHRARKEEKPSTSYLQLVWHLSHWAVTDGSPTCASAFHFCQFLVFVHRNKTPQKTHCGFWWPELMQMVPPAGSSPFGANGRGWTYLENFHHFTAKELELAHSLNSRGSSSLRTETSLVMMLESYPSCCISACNLS